MEVGIDRAPDARPAYRVNRTPAWVEDFSAYLLDLPIAFAVVFMTAIILRLLMATGLWAPQSNQQPEEAWSDLGAAAKLSMIIGFFLSTGPIYFALLHASPCQVSIGKRLMRIYVADNDRKRIGIGRSAARQATVCWLSPFGLNLVSLVLIAATREKKGLHDLVARTLVLNGRPTPGGSLEPWRIAVSIAVPVAWLVAAFVATL